MDFIEPAANPQTRTVPVHVHVANREMRLLPGMFVNATFVSRAAEPSIVVPRSAVLDTGTRKIVYLARPNGVFEAREVRVGAVTEDLFPVSSGLALGDKVVLNGNFLIDSQQHRKMRAHQPLPQIRAQRQARQRLTCIPTPIP